MKYLYGDSTASNLDVNYIEFLRDAVEFGVQVLLSDQRVVQGRAHIRTLEHATAAEMERLQKLPPLVAKAFEGTSLAAGDSATARCVTAISNAAGELVRDETTALRTALDVEVAKQNGQAGRERDGCMKALEALLLKHDLPETALGIHLAMHGARYECRARIKTGSGLEAVLEQEIPSNHLFERIVRVDRITERLDVNAPEVGGWLNKGVKQRTQHLEKHHLTELAIGASAGSLKLRVAPDGTGPGFDVIFSKQSPRARLARVDQQGTADQPFDVEDSDAKTLIAFYDKLVAAAVELGGHRKKLLDAKIDGEPLRTHGRPALLVERLIGAIAPTVQEIAARSQSPGELVLRRLLAGNRREEIFLAKSELKQMLEPLADANRSLFEPLWLSTPQAKLMASPPGGGEAPRSDPARGEAAGSQSARGRVTPSLGTSPLVMATAAAASASAPAPAPAAASQPNRSRPSTPAIGVTQPPATLDAPPPAAAATNQDVFRRTLIGAAMSQYDKPTDGAPAKPAEAAPAKPAEAAPAKPADNAGSKPIAAAQPTVPMPATSSGPRTVATGTIEVKQAGKVNQSS
jgi:hypothetical protein